MTEYRYTPYFENEVMRKRPYLKKEWCIYVVKNALKEESQDEGRIRFWARIPEFGNRALRVVTLADRLTIHNAFPDRDFNL